MTEYSRGEVILVPFPFTDLSDVKQRPALVISTKDYNNATGDVIIAQITSRTGSRARPGDYAVHDWRAAGLLAASLVRARMTTLDAALVRRKLGDMPPNEVLLIDDSLRIALGL